MNTITLRLALLLFSSSLFGQVVLEEDFSTATGNTPPDGWVNNAIIDNDIWTFDNPEDRLLNDPITNPAAILDSDAAGVSGPEEAALESPFFNTGDTSSVVLLTFDHVFRGGLGGAYAVEVSNGTSWVPVLEGTTSTPDANPEFTPKAESLDITSALRGASSGKVRFRWTGDFSWYWIVDNVTVTVLDCPVPAITTAITTDCVDESFTIMVNVSDLVGLSSIILENDGDAPELSVSEVGTYEIGPFNSGDTVRVTIRSGENALCAIPLPAITYSCPIPNDDCAGAILIEDGDVIAIDTTLATQDSNTCSGSDASVNGVWYTFTDNARPSVVDISLCNSDINTTLSVFKGFCNALVCVDDIDAIETCENDQASLQFESDGESTYYILAGGTDAATGNLEIALNTTPISTFTVCDIENDITPPISECEDISILGSGEDCSEAVVVNYELPTLTDDCVSRISQNYDETVNAAIDCAGETVGHLRVFDLDASGVSSSFVLTEVTIGVRKAIRTPEVTVHIYDLADVGGTVDGLSIPLSANVEPMVSTTVELPNLTNTLFTIPLYAVIQPETSFVIEVISSERADFVLGYNQSLTATSNDTAIGYVACSDAPMYAAPENLDANFETLAAIIIPSGYDLSINQTAGIASGALFPAGETLNTFEITDRAGNMTSCSFTITVGDEVAPEIDCPEEILAVASNEGEYISEDFTELASDNCSSGASLTVVQTPEIGTIFTVDETVTVELLVTDAAGNTTACSFTVFVDPSLGISEEILENSLSLYPNPTNGQLYVQNMSGISLENISVIDSQGRLIQDIPINKAGVLPTIDLSRYARGLYFITFSNATGQTVKRVIKQ